MCAGAAKQDDPLATSDRGGGMSEAPPSIGDAPPPARAGTERQRRTRQRRCAGLRSIEFDIRQNQVEKLILRGFLAPGTTATRWCHRRRVGPVSGPEPRVNEVIDLFAARDERNRHGPAEATQPKRNAVSSGTGRSVRGEVDQSDPPSTFIADERQIGFDFSSDDTIRRNGMATEPLEVDRDAVLQGFPGSDDRDDADALGPLVTGC